MIKVILRIALSLGVSFAILALLLQMFTTGLADADRPSISSVLSATSLSFVGGFFGLYLFSLLLRAYRYRTLIALSGELNTPSMRSMIVVTGVRNMVVDMLPARLGELGYVGLLNRGYGVKLEHCVSSLSISIALDFVALLVVVALVVVKQILGDGVTDWALAALLVATTLSLVAILGLFVITPWLVNSLLVRKPKWLNGGGWRANVMALAQGFSSSIQAVMSSGRANEIIVVSVLIRLLKYFGFYLLFHAVSVNSFPELAKLPPEHIISALIGGEIAASLPVPAFMSFGVYEAGSVLVFKLLGVGDQAATLITMLCIHLWGQAIEYLLGGSFIVVFLLHKRKLIKNAPHLPTSSLTTDVKLGAKRVSIIYLAISSFTLVLGTVFLAYQLWATTKLGALRPPSTGDLVTDSQNWQQRSAQQVSKLDGFIVFSSNRDGNHDIFKRDLSTFKLDKLTNHPNTETYPRISPNGKRVVFSRAHQIWVSQRNTVAWDIYVLDLETGEERKVGANGTAPHWLNNSEIGYLRDAIIVEKVNVDTLESSVLFQSGLNNMMPVGAYLYNPNYNARTEQLVFTARQSDIGSNTGHWGTAISLNGRHLAVLNGCELAWNAAGTGLYQVNPGGGDGTQQIVNIDPVTLEHRTLINLGGEFTHEYWPKDSSNGDYMVFGASRGADQHEHDTQDYEIFLWQVGSRADQAIRMTFHTGNENWPDVFIR